MILQTGPKMSIFSESKELNSKPRLKKIQPSTCIRSFTLIELLLVVILLGVVAGLVIPNFGPTLSNFQLKETARNISYVMRYAQSRSIIKNIVHELVFDDAFGKYQIKAVDEDQEISEAIKSRLGRVFSIPKEVVVTCREQRIRFNTDGRIEPVRILLSNDRGSQKTISTQEQVGHIHVFDFEVK